MSSIAARSQLALRLSFFLRRKRTSFGVRMQCPLSVVKQTSPELCEMFACDPNRASKGAIAFKADIN
jgi:hypothetical protein